MAKRVLSGFCKAARVTCDSMATRDELLAYGLLPPERVAVVPNGVHHTCSPQPDPGADREAARVAMLSQVAWPVVARQYLNFFEELLDCPQSTNG